MIHIASDVNSIFCESAFLELTFNAWDRRALYILNYNYAIIQIISNKINLS